MASAGARKNPILRIITCIKEYQKLEPELLFPALENIKQIAVAAQQAILLIDEYKALDPSLLSSSTRNIKLTTTAIHQAIACINEYRKLEQDLSLNYSARACLKINIEKIERDWAHAECKFWFLASMSKKKVGRRLATEGGTIGTPDVVADLAKLRKQKLLLGALGALNVELKGIPGWAFVESNLAKLKEALLRLNALDALSINLHSLPGWAFLESNFPKMKKALHLLSEMEAALQIINKDTLFIEVQTISSWAVLEGKLAKMYAALTLNENLRLSMDSMAQTPEHSAALRQAISTLVLNDNGLLRADGAIIATLKQLKLAFTRLTNALERFRILGNDRAEINADLAKLRQAADVICKQEAQLKSWCDWCRVRHEAQELGLKPLADAVLENILPTGGALEAFETAYARWFATQVIDTEPVLRNFVALEHMSDIEAYRQAEDHLSQLSVRYIRAKLCGLIPSKNDTGKQGGFAILKHELQKSRRHKPVRQLALEMGDAIQKLAPCMLMSPLSIAQYLPADLALFDLVIFDEASQITPWDAVGSIARGKQVVIAGDPRQMPPTSFFNRATSTAEDDTEDDMESILDECLGAGVPSHSLSWHYRSRHESLIAFSNHRYYENSLITFPAPETRASAVGYHYVDGVYSRGKERNNQAEAKALVTETVRRLTDPQFVAQGLSIGIITLNSDQQTLVSNLLDQARQKYPEIEPFFQESLPEPVFVKNLETAQGDERDLIMLGIGYGPTEPGSRTMSMNFGPLNKEGGWRRLNVALTRARREMLLFTSFDSAMIDLNRTSARAVRDLKHFIEFANRGPMALAEAVQGSVGGYDSPFEEAVSKAALKFGQRAFGFRM